MKAVNAKQPSPPQRSSAAAAWPPIAAAAAWAVALAGLGIWATELSPWYRALKQPAWQPPDSWFGPVWTTIYGLAATAAVKAWRATTSRSRRQQLVGAFVLNGALNVLWSWLFFRARRPDWALGEVALLWLSIALLVGLASRSSSTAATLLLPYLVWVAFAAALNGAVVRLNAPF
jgi:translocator protein